MKKLFIIAIAALFAVTACSSSDKKDEKSNTSQASAGQAAETPAQTEPAPAPEEAAKPEEKPMLAH